MVRANNEHTSGNKSEKNTSTRRTFFERLKFWKRHNENDRKPTRLTPMPACLMHWWTPLAIAILLFVSSMLITSIWGTATYDEIIDSLLHYPHRWPFRMHTPSHEAIKLCLTVTGAGLAFSAWQQRSHDNAVKEKQAQATVERDDYWKRREQIYQLLGSKNPGLRLSAVALLVELADTAAHSALLNDTEKQQLQRHIIDTLCLQVRHEGLCIQEEGDKREHTTIQQNILTSIFQRINHPQQDSAEANWSESTIGLNDCTILTPVSIRSITSNSTLDLRGTTFEKKVEISESSIKNILWDTTYFNSRLEVTNSSDIGMLRPPTYGRLIYFRDTTIRTTNPHHRFIISLPPSKQKNKIYFTKCRFYDTSCTCSDTCECRIGSKSHTCQCTTKKTCTCKNICINTVLWITTPRTPSEEEEQYPEITIKDCTIGRLRLLPSELGAKMTIKSNLIHEILQLFIGYRKATDAVHTHMRNIAKLIILEDNIIQISENPRISPIVFQSNTYSNIDNAISFNNISLRQGVEPERESKVRFQKTTTSFFDLFHFTTHPISDRQDILKTSWDTGSPSSTYHKALACNINQHDNPFEIQLAETEHLDFVSEAYEITRKVMSEYAIDTDWPDDHFSVACAVEDIERANCYIVYNGDTPCAAFALNPRADANNPDKIINWRSNMDYYMIQRISPANGEAVAHSIFDYAATRANYLRCLTHERNNCLRHALEVFGFKACGTFTATDGSIRVAYDWIKEPDLRNKS